MVATPHVPDAGDIVWLALSPQAGHEQAGRRPALVLSPGIYNRKSGLALFCPITSNRKGYPFEVGLPTTGEVTGVVLADQVKSLDWRTRRARFVCSAPPIVVGEVLDKLSILLGGR
ncbi:MAG: endoribonuclease MazF [Gemmatimonadota bacterium]|nr:endoribonuclease MazF [Gemmatimonadota bacterium]